MYAGVLLPLHFSVIICQRKMIKMLHGRFNFQKKKEKKSAIFERNELVIKNV